MEGERGRGRRRKHALLAHIPRSPFHQCQRQAWIASNLCYTRFPKNRCDIFILSILISRVPPLTPFFPGENGKRSVVRKKGFFVPFLLQLRPRLDQQYPPKGGEEQRYNAIFLKGMPRNVVISSAIIKNAHEKEKWGWQDGIMQHPNPFLSFSSEIDPCNARNRRGVNRGAIALSFPVQKVCNFSRCFLLLYF